MSFNDVQTRCLKAKLKRRYVKTRTLNGETLSYVEGWHAIAEANRIFGFGQWDRQTLAPHCHWANQQSGQTVCFYSTKVRISVRAGETVIVREGLGTGMGRSPQAEIAHDMAIKSAETDATKRALATFGNAFGLALYDPSQSQVTRLASPRSGRSDFVVTGLDGDQTTVSDPVTFTSQLLDRADVLKTVDDLYAFWGLHAAQLKRLGSDDKTRELAERIVTTFKERARQLAQRPAQAAAIPPAIPDARTGSYLLPKEKRLRDRAHLAFVAAQPCLICGRRPAQAHHLRFAQPRALALKVSDEFTVPLCNSHHDQLHRSGDERAFWNSHGVASPLQHAAKLWNASHGRPTTRTVDWDPDTEQEFNEPNLRKSTPPPTDGA